MVVGGKTKKARKKWAQLSIIMGREGANPRVTGMIFKAVMQAVILFSLEAWPTTPHMGRALGMFQHSTSRRTTGRHTRRIMDGISEYPTLEELIQDVRLE